MSQAADSGTAGAEAILAVELARQALERWAPEAAADSEAINAQAFEQIRPWVESRGLGCRWREDALALVRAAPLALQMEALDYPADLVMDLGRRVDGRLLVQLLRLGGLASTDAEGGASERAGLMEMALLDGGLAGPVIDPWVGPEHLDSSLPEAARITNEMRWLRLEGEVSNPWAAWSRLPGLTAPASGARLVWVMGLPGLERPALSDLGVQVDLTLSMADVSSSRGAQARRRAAVQRIDDALRKGMSVAWLANSTTIDSRRAPISAARANRADVHAVYFDEPFEQVRAHQEGLGWLVSERVLRRGAQVLEGPRPHEAEQVTVVRGGVIAEQWRATPWTGWA